jgi:hypothetical protein
MFWGDVYFNPLGTNIDSAVVPANTPTTNFASGGLIQRTPTSYDQTQSITAFIDETVTLAKFTNPIPEDHYFLTCYRIPQAGDRFHANLAIPENATPISGAIGEVWQADVSFVNGTGKIHRGEGTNTGGVLHWATTTVTGVGSGVQFGSLAAGESLYAWLAVDTATIAGTSPTLDVLVERAAADSWGAPTTVYTFSQATDAPANTYQLKTTETGAQAEEWYRVSYTIAGAGASFRWFCGLAVV